MRINDFNVKVLLKDMHDEVSGTHELCNSVDSSLEEVEIEIRERLCKVKERINTMLCLIDWEEDK